MTDGRCLALVPAYDAAQHVEGVVRSLEAIWPRDAGSCSVLVVDDGSRDDTASLAASAGARVVRHDCNRGKGAALRTGFAEARRLGATSVVTVDADGQHPPEEALRLAHHPAPQSALVLGVRDLVRDGAPGANRFSNGISNYFLSLFSGRTLRDTQCGLRRYPLPAILELGGRDDGYAFESECILRAILAGWTVVEEPIRVHYPSGAARVTHFDSVRDPARIVRRVLITLATASRRKS